MVSFRIRRSAPARGCVSSTGQEIGANATHATLKSGQTSTKKLTIPYASG
jgi:hypothetical protein